jgi:pimeloyl-ACP methyl ester carboxylesterase
MAPSATNKTSLSSSKPTSSGAPTIEAYRNLAHPPHPKAKLSTTVKPLTISVEDGPDGGVPGFLHLPGPKEDTYALPSHATAAILLSGAGGGIVGPSSIYLSLAEKLASLHNPIPTLRLDYRFPARNKYCTDDVLAAMTYLETEHGLNRFVLVGWSFGGAPVFTAAGVDERVVGCATVASQTAETEGIRDVGKRGVPVLLLHGTGDRTLSPACSERLFQMYGNRGTRELKLFDGDDHALTRNSAEAERRIGEFIMRCAGVDEQGRDYEVLKEKLISDGEKVELMRKGGDLRREESTD